MDDQVRRLQTDSVSLDYFKNKIRTIIKEGLK